jgi:predicted phosphoribosyltransferase
VCARDAAARLTTLAQDVVCVQSPADFLAVGFWYEDFSPTTDQEVIDALAKATGESPAV